MTGKSETAEVHWHEGMFLLPHHYQTSGRSRHMLECEKTTNLNAYWWGIGDLLINSAALAGFRIKIDRAVFRLKDGTWINVPDNGHAAEKSFEGQKDQLDTGLPVWFGVRRPEPHRPLVHELGEEEKGVARTFVLKENTVADENNGQNEQTILSRLWNVQVFFGPHPGDQFEAMQIGEMEWSSSKLPVFKADHIPPLLHITASSFLRERTKNVVVKLSNQANFLQGEMSAKRISLTGDPLRILANLSRLQVSASYSLLMQQLLNAEHIHPFHLYLELVRLAGELVALYPDTRLNIPPYDHDNLTFVMETVMKLIEQMIEGGVVVDYIHRRFEIEGDQRVCRIDKEWLEPAQGTKVKTYLCIVTDMTESQVDAMLSDYRVKIAPPSRMEELIISRTRGLSCQRLRRIPSGLPDKSGLHYYQVDISRTSEFWLDLCRDLYLVIYGIPVDATSDISLYVHIEQGEK
ncbi:MAG: type VI secretion system baseplate subunit TssK [Pseudomonadota bacterium]